MTKDVVIPVDPNEEEIRRIVREEIAAHDAELVERMRAKTFTLTEPARSMTFEVADQFKPVRYSVARPIDAPPEIGT